MPKRRFPGYGARIAVWSSLLLFALAGYLWQTSAELSTGGTGDGGITGLFFANPPADCHTGERGGWDYCVPDCPCYAGEGDCDTDWDCVPGTVCVANAGEAYGYDRATDVCMIP